MENDANEFHSYFMELLHVLRKKANITVAQLCADSHVSTRTYSKMVQNIPVKEGCYHRLVLGSCKGATREEFTTFWQKLGEWIYISYS